MNAATVRVTLTEWALNHGLDCRIQEQSTPPPFLDIRPPWQVSSGSGRGLCLTTVFQSPSIQAQSTFGCWIPLTSSVGTYLAMCEGDEEISPSAVDWFSYQSGDQLVGAPSTLAGADALRANLDAALKEFRRDFIFAPALESWLQNHGHAYERFTLDMVDGIELWDEKNWRFFLLPAEPLRSSEPYAEPDYSSSRVVGITGDGRAGLFSYNRQDIDPRCYVDAISLENETNNLRAPKDLHAWLNASISLDDIRSHRLAEY